MEILIHHFTNGNLEFSDFAILAILIAILYGLTAMEYFQLNSSNFLFKDSKEKNLRKAGTWSFYGILLTILAGWMADMDLSPITEYPMVIVPLFFIFRWAGFHIKGSNIVDLSLVKKNIDYLIKKEIIKQLKESYKHLSTNTIYENLMLNEDKFERVEEIISKSTSSGEIIFNRSGLKEIISPFLIKKETIIEILKDLEKKGIINYNQSNTCYYIEVANNG